MENCEGIKKDKSVKNIPTDEEIKKLKANKQKQVENETVIRK